MSGDLFSSLSFFDNLETTQLDLLRSLFSPCEFSSGMHLFEQGECAENLYLVVNGEIVVNYKPDDGPALVVAHVSSGGIVGWSAALGSQAYTSGAYAASQCSLLRVRGSDLRQLCETDPQTGAILLDRLAAVIAERLRNTHAQVKAM